MNEPIPYYHFLEEYKYCFISPEGTVLFNNEKHNDLAKYYCLGNPLNKLPNEFGNKKISDILNNIYANNDESIFYSKMISPKEHQLFSLWMNSKDSGHKEFYADFLVFVLGYDKVESVIQKSITTSSLTPHVRLYNYYLMDWNVYPCPKLIYNEKDNAFDYSNSTSYLYNSKDFEAAEEIEDIKAHTHIKDRHLFLK